MSSSDSGEEIVDRKPVKRTAKDSGDEPKASKKSKANVQTNGDGDEMDPPLSPMEPLDPHRLRDMVVDKQGSNVQMGSNSMQHWSPAHVSQSGPTASPASVDSPHSVSTSQRLSTGSADVNSPFQARPASQQPQHFDFNPPRTPMYPGTSASPAKVVNQQMQQQQQHMMSPVGRSPQQQQSQVSNHPPASPFPRTSSAASSNACPSPFSQPAQINQQFQGSPMYPPGAYPNAAPRMPTYSQQQQGYPAYAQVNGQWQAVHPGYVAQPRMMAPGHPAQRPMMRYPQGAYPQGPVGQHVMYQQARPVRPMQYQTPPGQVAAGNGTAVPQSPAPQPAYPQSYPAHPMAPQQPAHYYMSPQQQQQQQQRIHQAGQAVAGTQMMRGPYMQTMPPGTPGTPVPGQPPQMPQGPNGQPVNAHVRYIQNGVPPGQPGPGIQYGQAGPAPPGAVHQLQSEMRPPPLLSPSQGQIPPSMMRSHMQQPHPNMPNQPMYPNMHGPVPMQTQGQMMHMPGQPGMSAGPSRVAQPIRANNYFDHDPHWQHRVNGTDTFLAGCVFLFVESVDSFEPLEVHNQLSYYGADVVDTARGNVTHVVCDFMSTRARDLAKNLRQARFVTSHYVSDVLAKRKLSPPFKASHLPSAWDLLVPASLPGQNRVFATEGFTDEEVESIKTLCRGIGARFNGCLTKNHAALIAKGESGRKSVKAAEWDIPVVNYLWLVRLYYGINSVIAEMRQPEHSAGVQGTGDILCGPHFLERISDHSMTLLMPWKAPILLNEVLIQRAAQIREQVEQDVLHFPHHKFKFTTDAPTDEQIEKALEIRRREDKQPNVRVFIDRLPSELADHLSRKLRFLGAQLAESIVDCTHFVTPDLRRTVNLCEALALGRDVVEPSWIDHSFSCLSFVDAFDFRVRDPDNERKFGFNVLNTIYRARIRQIFEDVTFHVSPNVQPSYDVLQKLIQCAGGSVVQAKPTYKEIAHCIQYDKTFIIVINDNDLSEYEYLWEKKIPLFTEEFVMMSIVRHDFDTSAAYRLNPPAVDEPHLSSPPKVSAKAERVKVI